MNVDCVPRISSVQLVVAETGHTWYSLKRFPVIVLSAISGPAAPSPVTWSHAAMLLSRSGVERVHRVGQALLEVLGCADGLEQVGVDPGGDLVRGVRVGGRGRAGREARLGLEEEVREQVVLGRDPRHVGSALDQTVGGALL